MGPKFCDRSDIQSKAAFQKMNASGPRQVPLRIARASPESNRIVALSLHVAFHTHDALYLGAKPLYFFRLCPHMRESERKTSLYTVVSHTARTPADEQANCYLS